jgi:septal ring factor EnvC (AmiA/AmiB activator)
MPKRSKSIIAAIAGMILIATGFALSPAYAVPDYPTAAEVAAAKRNVEEKKKMISRIEGILNTLQDEADALESVALQKNEQYNQAKQAAKIMADKVEGLEAKVKTAEEEAGEAKTMLGQIVARMYRQGTSGNTTLEIFFNPESSDELLYQLGASDVVAQRTQVMYEQAMQKQSDAKALAAELSSAQAELETRRAASEMLYREA